MKKLPWRASQCWQPLDRPVAPGVRLGRALIGRGAPTLPVAHAIDLARLEVALAMASCRLSSEKPRGGGVTPGGSRVETVTTEHLICSVVRLRASLKSAPVKSARGAGQVVSSGTAGTA